MKNVQKGGRALPTIAQEINAEHEAAEQSINDALQHARRCGELLIEAKSACGHGEWGKWLNDNFRASQRTANGYMRIAANSQRVANMSIRDALAELAEPRETAPALPPAGLVLFGVSADDVHAAVMESPRAGFYKVAAAPLDAPYVDMTKDHKPVAGDAVFRALAALGFDANGAEWITTTVETMREVGHWMIESSEHDEAVSEGQ